MIATILGRKLFPMLAMLLMLAGMMVSVIGEASSHGIAELTEFEATDGEDKPHSHDTGHHDTDKKTDAHLHHDSGNHTHESADRLTIHFSSDPELKLWQPIPFAGDSPRSFRYRLDRPPKSPPMI